MIVTNRKARYEYSFIKEYIAGIQLFGSEVKSIVDKNISIDDAYCMIINGEMFVKDSYIAKYNFSTYMNHDEKRDRKLLLSRKEINEIHRLVKLDGLTIVVLGVFKLNGKFKLKIALAKGKKTHDKRESIKEKDLKRENDRFYK